MSTEASSLKRPQLKRQVSGRWQRRYLTCPECQDIYKTPKELRCSHIFCKTCLDAMLSRSQNKYFIECSTCHMRNEVPEGGDVSLFPDSDFTNTALEAWMQLNPTISSLFSSASDEVASRQSSEEMGGHHDPKACPLHSTNKLELFCQQCQVVICFQCTLYDHRHHKFDLVADVLQKHNDDLKQLLEPLQNMVIDAERVLDKVNMMYQEGHAQNDAVQLSVNSFFDEAELMLKARRRALIDKLNLQTKDKLLSLSKERSKRESIHTQLFGASLLLTEAIAKKDLDMLQAKEKVIKVVEESSKKVEPLSEKYLEDMGIGIQLSLPQDLLEKLGTVGEFLVPDPLMCVVSGLGLKFAEVGQTSVVTITINTNTGEPFQHAVSTLESKLILQDNHTTVKCDIKKREFNSYKIHYTPTKRGQQHLHIKINQKHVKDSPFPIMVRLPVKKLGRPVKVISNVTRPWGVATTLEGDIIVSECQKHVVRVYDSQGQKKRTYGSTPGSEKTQFYYPCGVAVDDLGFFYIADTGNRRIQKLTADGRHIAWAGQKGSGAKEFIDPKDMIFNTVSKKLYIADSPRVQVLDPNLVFCGQIGNRVLKNSFGIACDTTGNIYVSDNRNKNIQKFTHDGKLLVTFNSSIRNCFPCSCIPLTVATDTCGFLYVMDEATCKIFVLDTTGTCVASFGREGTGPGEFKKPHTITVDESGKVYVCDNGNNRLQIF